MMKISEMQIIDEIIGLCMGIKKSVLLIYTEYACNCYDEEIKTFWSKMAVDSAQRLEYWNKLKGFSEEGSLPIIFQEPMQIKKELSENISNINKMIETDLTAINLKNKYILAFGLEYFRLRMAFATICNFIKDKCSDKKTPANDHEKHLNYFMESIKRHSRLSPELRLVALTKCRLWKEDEALSKRNMIDFLTGVHNKTAFFQLVAILIHIAQNKSKIVGFIFLDIDDFKKVNDLYAHQAGERVLKMAAQIVMSSFRKRDIVGRFGGDELIVFLPIVEKGLTKSIAERICRNIANESAKTMPVTASIGFYEDIANKDVKNKVAEFIKNAENYLYEAKNNGKGCVIGNRNDRPELGASICSA